MDRIHKSHLAVQLAFGKFAVSLATPSLISIGPEPLNYPAGETIEESADVGLAIVLPPAAYDRVDVLDELLDGYPRPAAGPLANVLLEPVNGFLCRVCVAAVGLRSAVNLVRGQMQLPRASLDFVPEKLKALRHMHDTSLLFVQCHP